MFSKKWLAVAVVVIALVCAGAGGVYVYKNNINKTAPAANSSMFNRPPDNNMPADGNGPDMANRPGAGIIDINQIIAQALGVEPEKLRQELDSGKTVEELAKVKGMTTKQLQDKVLAGLKDKLTQAVKDGKLTQEQSDQMYQRLESGITSGRWPQRPRPEAQ